ncbi:phage tail tape measure protein [Cupriavidus sp. UGS-1]|uniref:phage tail tape measure protein n=1 Tax=Cupriavidus sp. UGS-1 TaxID=2899826 RepID=UPI001E541E72|nr:phage tail tape measure protein [Cupriavidus sp. UGS-1]MCD9123999.1 phage tail tape measure protein [Cupriavidus sp. UGS-1]
MATQDLKLRVLADFVDRITAPIKRVMNGSRDMGRALKESRDQLKALSQAQKDVGAFRELLASSKASANALAVQQQKVNALAAALRAGGPPSKAMTREFEAAKRAAAALAAAHTSNTTKLQELRTRLAGAGIDTRNLATHERALRSAIADTTGTIRAQQKALAELGERERKLAAARQRMNATGQRAGALASGGAKAMAGGAAAIGATAVPVAAYAEAEDAATGLQVALMRAGSVVPPEFQKINDLALRLGDRLPGTTADFQNMMTMLTRQGISAQAILGGMGEATAYLAVQLKKTPDEAAEFAAKLQDATRTSERDMLALMDVIQRTFYLGVDDNNMLQGFSKLSSAMDTVKMKGLEGAKAFAPFLVMADQAGMKGEAAGNALRKVFQAGFDGKKMSDGNDLIANAAKTNPALRGVQLDFTDGKGEFGGLDKMFAQFDKLRGLSTETRTGVIKAIFGDDAETLQIVSLIVEKGAAGYAEVQAKMAAQASLQERVNRQLGTLKNLWDAASGTFTNAMVAFGEAIAPELKAVTEWIGNVSQSLGAWGRENPALAGGIMKVIAIVGVLLISLGGLAIAAAGILGPFAMLRFSMTALGMQGGMAMRVLGLLAGAFRAAGSAALFVGRLLLANPIGLLVAGIAVAALLVIRYWEPIKAFFAGLWEQIRQAFAGGLGGIAALILNWSPIGLFYQAFAGVLSWFGVELPARFTEFGANIVAGLVNGITSAIGTVTTAIGNVANSVTGFFREKLGIHSPSRVMAELGGNVSQGAALGIEAEQGAVAQATRDLAAVAVTEFQPGSSTGAGFAVVRQQGIDMRPAAIARPQGIRETVTPGSGSSTGAGIASIKYEITINGAGASNEELARAVRAEIEKVERERQSRGLSRLSD